MFSIIKRIVSPATVRKFHPISSGSNLASELKGLDIPKEYGGSGASIKEGVTVMLAAPAAPAPAPAEAAAPAEAEVVAEAVAEAPKEDKAASEKSS